MPHKKHHIRKTVSMICWGLACIIGFAMAILMSVAILRTFVIPAKILPAGDIADAIYSSAEKLGANGKDFLRYLNVLSEEARMLPGMIEAGADPMSATRFFLTRVQDVYKLRLISLAGAYGCSLIFGILITIESVMKITEKKFNTGFREKKRKASERWHDKALYLRRMAAYLDEGRFAEEGWEVPEEGAGWEGSEEIDTYFRNSGKAMSILDEIPQWYWEMVEGELAVHIKTNLDSSALNTTILRIEALSEFIMTIFNRHTQGPLTSSSSEVRALKDLTEKLVEMDYRDTLARDIIRRYVTGNSDRGDFFLSSFAPTDQWYVLVHDLGIINDYYSEPEPGCVTNEETCFVQDSDPDATPADDQDTEEVNEVSSTDVVDNACLVPDECFSDEIAEDPDDGDIAVSDTEAVSAEDAVTTEEAVTTDSENVSEKALLYASYLKGMISGMMTDDRLTSKEATALKTFFASWPSDVGSTVLELLVAPFTETKARPRTGEMRTLCSALDTFICNRINSVNASEEKLDDAGFSGLARGIIADETICADDVRVLREWMDAHDFENESRASVRNAVEEGNPLAIYNTLRNLPVPEF